MVPSSEISVVIQGPLYRSSDEYGIEATIESIRRCLPDAEIIISTWIGEDTSGLEYHQLVVSEQPVKLLDRIGNPNYLGHQIKSTKCGIALSTKPYVLKIRADHSLLSNQFCLNPEKVNKDSRFAVFNNKVIVSSFFLRNSLKVPFLFHISDLLQFGKREDLITFWTLPIPTLEELLQKSPKGHLGLFGNYCGAALFREAPEQTIILSLLKKINFVIDLPYPCATKYEWFYIWENLLSENFHVIDADKPIIVFPHRFNNAFLGKKTVLREMDLKEIKKNPGSKLRYGKLLFNKYFLVWFHPRYWMSTLNIILSRIYPSLAQKVRVWLRKKLGLTHDERK